MGKTWETSGIFGGKVGQKRDAGFLFERRWEHLEEIDGIGGNT